MEKWSMEGINGGYEINVKDNTWPDGSRPIARTTNTGKNAADFKATAQLMAAAPELLEALKGMMIWAKTTAMYHLRDEESLPRGFEKWKQLIDKAEGKI